MMEQVSEVPVPKQVYKKAQAPSFGSLTLLPRLSFKFTFARINGRSSVFGTLRAGLLVWILAF